jgi:hypothetical protein
MILNGTHQHLVYAGGVNLLCKNINTINNDKGTLLHANKKVGLEVNTEKTMFMSHGQNTG